MCLAIVEKIRGEQGASDRREARLGKACFLGDILQGDERAATADIKILFYNISLEPIIMYILVETIGKA